MVIIKSKKAQTYSADIMIVVVILLIGVLFVVVNKLDTTKTTDLKLEEEKASVNSNLIVDNLKTQNIIDSQNNVNVEKLLLLNHSQLKEELGITTDFAIAFEKNGKIIKIDPSNNINCIGSGNIVINDIACK